MVSTPPASPPVSARDAPYCVSPLATPDERAAIMARHAREALDDPAVRVVAAGIACAHCAPRERAAAVLRRAQACGFVPDPPGCDAYRPVRETLARGGDCDDLTPTVLALATLAGFEGRIAYMAQAGAPQDHVTAQLYVDGAWRWAEASVPGARLGEHPYDAARRVGRYAAFGGTGLVGGVTDGVIANLLTVGLLAAVAYLGAKAGTSARRNPSDGDDPTAKARAAYQRLTELQNMHWREGGFASATAHARAIKDATRAWKDATAHVAGPRRNPAPNDFREVAYLAPEMGPERETRRGLVWSDGKTVYRLNRQGDQTEFTWGRGSPEGGWEGDPSDVAVRGPLDKPLSADALRAIGMARYVIFEQMRTRFAELEPSDFIDHSL